MTLDLAALDRIDALLRLMTDETGDYGSVRDAYLAALSPEVVGELLRLARERLRARCEQAERGEREEHACVVALQQAVDTLRQTVGQAERERDEWRHAADNFHVVNWIGTADDLTPKEAFKKALEGALDQDRDELRDRVAALEAHVREWRARHGDARWCAEAGCPFCGLISESLALVPDETGKQ